MYPLFNYRRNLLANYKVDLCFTFVYKLIVYGLDLVVIFMEIKLSSILLDFYPW